MGAANTHPDPVSLKYRIRRFILCRKNVLVSLNQNTRASCNPNALVVETLQNFKENSSPIRKKSILLNKKVENEDELLTHDLIDFDFPEDEEVFRLPSNEEDGFSYVMGYIVHKFHVKYDFLKSLDKIENDWISYKDEGGLKRMKGNVQQKFLQLEGLFRSWHFIA